MSLNTLLRQDIQIITPATGIDDYGNVTFDWAHPTTSDELGLLEPGVSAEVTVGRDTVVADAKAFLAVDSAITALSRVVVDGRTYEVVGQPGVWNQGSPATWHTEAFLRALVSG